MDSNKLCIQKNLLRRSIFQKLQLIIDWTIDSDMHNHNDDNIKHNSISRNGRSLKHS